MLEQFLPPNWTLRQTVKLWAKRGSSVCHGGGNCCIPTLKTCWSYLIFPFQSFWSFFSSSKCSSRLTVSPCLTCTAESNSSQRPPLYFMTSTPRTVSFTFFLLSFSPKMSNNTRSKYLCPSLRSSNDTFYIIDDTKATFFFFLFHESKSTFVLLCKCGCKGGWLPTANEI